MKRYMKRSLCVLLAMVLVLGAAAALAEEKKEIVYVLADAAGQPRRVIVNEQTQDDSGEQTDEQSEGDAPLPVNVTLRYELDGAAVEPADLAGKSGRLAIYIDYASNLTGTARVKGEDAALPVPFLAATVLPLDGDVFSNVEVTNGRLVHTGRVNAAVCIGLPGLGEALNVGGYPDIDLDLAIPTGAVIRADVANFHSDGAYTVVTGIPDALADGELPADLGAKGALDPQAAEATLTNRVNALVTGVSSLAAGAESVSSGASTLSSGASELSKGLNALSAESAGLTEGADQMIAAILEGVNGTLAASAETFAAAGIEISALTLDNYADELDRIEGALAAAGSGADSPAYQSLEALRGRLDGVKAFRDGLASYTEGVGQAAEGAKSVSSGAGKLNFGAMALSAGAKTLDDNVQKVRDVLDGDVRELLDRAKAVAALRYDGYLDPTVDATLFILRADGIDGLRE